MNFNTPLAQQVDLLERANENLSSLLIIARREWEESTARETALLADNEKLRQTPSPVTYQLIPSRPAQQQIEELSEANENLRDQITKIKNGARYYDHSALLRTIDKLTEEKVVLVDQLAESENMRSQQSSLKNGVIDEQRILLGSKEREIAELIVNLNEATEMLSRPATIFDSNVCATSSPEPDNRYVREVALRMAIDTATGLGGMSHTDVIVQARSFEKYLTTPTPTEKD